VIFYLIDQREWPFILPGPRTRAWRQMWHETLEFQSGEVPEDRYVLVLAVNCRNKRHQIPCHQPLSPVVLHRRTFTFPTKIQWKDLGGANRPRTLRHRTVTIYREVPRGEPTPGHNSRVRHHWKGEERQTAAVLRGSPSKVAVHEAVSCPIRHYSGLFDDVPGVSR
jgi:hypothetical protein